MCGLQDSTLLETLTCQMWLCKRSQQWQTLTVVAACMPIAVRTAESIRSVSMRHCAVHACQRSRLSSAAVCLNSRRCLLAEQVPQQRRHHVDAEAPRSPYRCFSVRCGGNLRQGGEKNDPSETCKKKCPLRLAKQIQVRREPAPGWWHAQHMLLP